MSPSCPGRRAESRRRRRSSCVRGTSRRAASPRPPVLRFNFFPRRGFRFNFFKHQVCDSVVFKHKVCAAARQTEAFSRGVELVACANWKGSRADSAQESVQTKTITTFVALKIYMYSTHRAGSECGSARRRCPRRRARGLRRVRSRSPSVLRGTRRLFSPRRAISGLDQNKRESVVFARVFDPLSDVFLTRPRK